MLARHLSCLNQKYLWLRYWGERTSTCGADLSSSNTKVIVPAMDSSPCKPIYTVIRSRFNCAIVPYSVHSLNPMCLFLYFISSSHRRIMVSSTLFTYLLTSKLSHQLSSLEHRSYTSVVYTARVRYLNYISRSLKLRLLIEKCNVNTTNFARTYSHRSAKSFPNNINQCGSEVYFCIYYKEMSKR